jgi:hypothetical protein
MVNELGTKSSITIIPYAQVIPIRKYTDIAPAIISKLISRSRIMPEKRIIVTNPKKKSGMITEA